MPNASTSFETPRSDGTVVDDIHLQCDGLTAGFLDLGDELRQPVGAACGKADLGAIGGKLQRRGSADAARCTRDESDFSLE